MIESKVIDSEAMESKTIESKMMDSKLADELVYQRDRAMQIRQVRPTDRDVVERYRAHRSWRLFNKEFIFKSLGNLDGKTVLDFGCGEGNLGVQIGLLGARVEGVDISPDLIDLARRRAELDHVEDRVHFQASDILESTPADESFDFVVCTDALHHVDIGRVVPILMKCLKPGGRLIAKEPISFSRTFQAVRDRMPIKAIASPGDRQLTEEDLAAIRGPFQQSEVTYFNLFGRLSRFFPNANRIDRGHPFTKMTLIALLGVDRILVTVFPFLRRFCGEVVIVAQKAN
jgi:2-polyprenyl-3-methyl-5-hydroxy-6-metoxy-1,4-benzoquinol methylase